MKFLTEEEMAKFLDCPPPTPFEELPLQSKIRRIKRKLYYDKKLYHGRTFAYNHKQTETQNIMRLRKVKVDSILRLYGDYIPFSDFK